MRSSHIHSLTCSVVLSASLAASNFSGPLSPALALTPAQPDAALEARLSAAYGRLPLHFEANSGQTDAQVRFLARGKGYTLFLTPSQAVLSLRKSAKSSTAVRLEWLGANHSALIQGQVPIGGVSNYLSGKDPSRWQTGIQHYSKVHYRGVYAGIDLVYYGNQGQLEYDWVVAAKADPKQIKLRVEGAERIEIDRSGELVVHIGGGEVRQPKPRVYQRLQGKTKQVAGRYVMLDKRTVGFALGKYDPRRELVIDPVLSYSTYLHSTSASDDIGDDDGVGIAIDQAGNAYVTGATDSSTFPTTVGAFQTTSASNASDVADAFVTKFNATGSELIYSTYLGGTGDESGKAIEVDQLGNAYISGFTTSADFPVTAEALQSTLSGSSDVFVTKLNATGTALIYSTYLGGSGGEFSGTLAVDQTGNAYVTSSTDSRDFPTTAGAFQRTYGGGSDVVIAKLSVSGSALVYSTYLGRSGDEFGFRIAVDRQGNAYVTGTTTASNFPTTVGAFQTVLSGIEDAFITKLNETGSNLVYSTYLGGNSEDRGNGVAVDRQGNAYVAGGTYSTDFPTTVGAFQTTYPGNGSTDHVFVTKLNVSGDGLVYSTYLGGSDGVDRSSTIALNREGGAYVTGSTSSTDFPTTANAPQRNFGGYIDAFVTRLDITGSTLVYSTYLGGSNQDGGAGIAVDNSGSAYVTGSTIGSFEEADFPVTVGAYQTTYGGLLDAVVTKLSK